VIAPAPVQLEGHGIRLEPLTAGHGEGLAAAAADGQLWKLWFSSVPGPDQTTGYIAEALDGQRAGHMLPWAVRELETGAIAGSTRFHDIAVPVDRVEIGYTPRPPGITSPGRATASGPRFTAPASPGYCSTPRIRIWYEQKA